MLSQPLPHLPPLPAQEYHVSIDLLELLGTEKFFAGVKSVFLEGRGVRGKIANDIHTCYRISHTRHPLMSSGISWDPFFCMPPYKDVWPNITDQDIAQLTMRMVKV